jgi:agmatinase
MSNACETGRLNLPLVGIASFGKNPYQPDWSVIDADFAILGAPFDFGTPFRAETRFGPRGIREASTLFSFGHAGAYDHEDDVTCLDGVRILDIGDADIVHTDTETFHANIETGVRHGHGNPMRRAAEQDHVTGITALGIRNVSSTTKDGNDAARKMGDYILSVRQIRKLGIEATLARIPKGIDHYLTIDIDGFDPSIAPGTGTPSHGGFPYCEVLELIDGLTKQGNIIGIDLVEVAPDHDHSGTTTILAAQILLNTIGPIAHNRR